ncbi:hypothetical protein GC163_14030 [bacterium]|nr:hypothetical protein [bacterium]
METPVALSDDDFEDDFLEDAPEGYLSEAAKNRFVGIVASIGVAYFILQIFLPQMIMYAMNPKMMPGRMVMETLQLSQAISYGEQFVVPVMQLSGTRPGYALRFINADGSFQKEGDIKLPSDVQSLVIDADGTSLWIVSSNCVSHWVNEQLTTIYPSTPISPSASAFLHDGQLRVIDAGPKGSWRCLDYVNGQWVVTGWLIMPPASAVTTTPALPTLPRTDKLQVVMQDNVPWVIYSNGTQLWRTRGLLLTDSDPEAAADEPVSALMPVNTGPWELLPLNWKSYTDWRVLLENDRMLIAAVNGRGINNQIQLFHWDLTGQAGQVTTSSGLFFEHFQILADSNQTATVLIDTFPPGGLRTLVLEGSTLVDGISVGNTSLFPMFGENFLETYSIVWGVSLALPLVFVATIHGIMLYHRQRRYAFGHGRVQLATLGRRSIARALDTMLFWLPLIPVGVWVAQYVEVDKLFQKFTADVMGSMKTILLVFVVFFVYSIAYTVIMGAMQGLWGLTPGKWLCGLRVIRTNFERITILRGIARELLMMIDAQFQFIVGVLMIAFLVKCQRLGDLVADSIVVEASSLVDLKPEATS